MAKFCQEAGVAYIATQVWWLLGCIASPATRNTRWNGYVGVSVTYVAGDEDLAAEKQCGWSSTKEYEASWEKSKG